MRTYSERAWAIASLYSHMLASETRDLAVHIDLAIGEALERAAKVADETDPNAYDVGKLIRALRDKM